MVMEDDYKVRLLDDPPPAASRLRGEDQPPAPGSETEVPDVMTIEWSEGAGSEDNAPPPPPADGPEDENLTDPRPRKQPIGVFAPAFADTHRRFWEKTAAFWAITLPGIVGACMVMWLGALEPLIACTLACGLTAGVAALQAIPRTAPRIDKPGRVLLPVMAASLVIGGGALLGIRSLLFRPSAAGMILWGVGSYLGLFYLLSFLGPLGAYAPPRKWPSEAWQMTMNWHRAAGIVILTSVYALLIAPAAIVLPFAPRKLGGRLSRLAESPTWAWLLPLARISLAAPSFERGLKPPSNSALVTAVGSAARAAAAYLSAVPLIAAGSWYVVLTSATRLLTEMGSVCLASAGEGAQQPA